MSNDFITQLYGLPDPFRFSSKRKREFEEAAIFRHRGVGFTDDLVGSTDTDYVMSRIRQDNLEDSTVTVVLMVGR